MRYRHDEVLVRSMYKLQVMGQKSPLRKLLQSASFYFGAAAPATRDRDKDTGNGDHSERDSRDECNRTESEPG